MTTTFRRATRANHSARGITRRRGGEWDVAVQLGVDRVGERRDVERAVRRTIVRLRRQFPDIESCQVSFDALPPGHRRGRRHRVRIGIVLHGLSRSAGRGPASAAHEDAMVAIHDAFADPARDRP